MPRTDKIFGRNLEVWMYEKYSHAENKSKCVEMLATDLCCSVMWVWQMLKGRMPGPRMNMKLYDLGFRDSE